jgi:phosphoribosylamine-glycine ligase
MKILYITNEFLAPDLALRIKNEGHDISIAIKEDNIDVLKGTLKRISYENRLKIAPSCDLIIYDDKSNGEAAKLRAKGLSVIGGGIKTDEIELNRVKANKLAEVCGMQVPKIQEVKNLKEAKDFIEKTGGKWVLKQMGKLDGIKGLNSCAKMDNSEDVIITIDRLIEKWPKELKQEFILQEKIEGHEFACGSYWNGKEFMKDNDGDEICEENWEHKPLMSGNMGESTGEMFTIMHYIKAKDSKIFSETLNKFREMLKKIDFRGDFDVNCIVNKKGVFFLEFTPRMGVPATSAQIAIQKTPWFDFLKAVADGTQVEDYKYNQGYCIVSWLYTKPFPAMSSKKVQEMAMKILGNKKDEVSIAELMNYKLSDSYGMQILFKEKLNKEELNNLHFDAVMYEKGQLKISNSDGYIMTITGIGETVDEAAEKTENLLKKITVQKSFYRNDFKNSNYHKSRNDLIDLGFLKEEKTDELSEIKKILK